MQQAYEIEARDVDTRAPVGRSGRIESPESHLVPWSGDELAARQRVQWRVHVHGNDGATATSEWSEFEIGLVDPSDWTAAFVVPDAVAPADPAQPVAYLRTEFTAASDVVRARLHVTALGAYEVEVNGTRAGDHVLAPGWTAYQHRLRVETYGVTALVRAGADNAIGVMLADGWYGERYGFDDHGRRLYGDELAALVQLELVDRAGTVHRVGTDETWRSSTGPIVRSGIYDGETYDARRELAGWSRPGFDDASWPGVHRHDGPRGALVGRIGPPVRRTEEVAPVAITTSPSGATIVDFGQNLVGRIRLRVRGATGCTARSPVSRPARPATARSPCASHPVARCSTRARSTTRRTAAPRSRGASTTASSTPRSPCRPTRARPSRSATASR